ncbi:hypothetical protein HK101_008568 [Irineochytrium annulatum]|nr:hypothetical protein HK101_008568 [Irineochytrium annulatum]
MVEVGSEEELAHKEGGLVAVEAAAVRDATSAGLRGEVAAMKERAGGAGLNVTMGAGGLASGQMAESGTAEISWLKS